ncbi:hypothetical protein CVIRNUC_004157 [Coccomyxa viridis]|uniref:Beta-amylase n=1 Tax=Coccomyxa viridis TaxID=1274662 RepID=A0AAV1I2L9_9CHLO|nr:hypothetical protein CVIRNUC_004157 [Coccomyxa viridis]
MRASLSHLYSGVQLSDKAAPSTEKAVLIRRHSAQHLPILETPPGYERPSIRAVQQSASTKVDYRPVRPDRLARAPYRSGPRARERTQPLGAVMGHDCTFKARPIGGESCSGQDQGSFSSADLQRELPSVGEALDRQAPVASTSQPSIGKQNNTQSDPSKGVRVYVMLPLDTVSSDGQFRYANSKWFASALERLKLSGVHGMAIDVWWGAVERRPQQYDWSGYSQVFEAVKAAGLKLQAVMSFHACGGNVGDSAEVPLPPWVLKAGEQDPDIFFTDRPRDSRLGKRNREYVSIFADEAPRVLAGRCPVECYADFMRAFRDHFAHDLGTAIEEVVVGTGPCGELRYPSYVEANGWRFPGIGELQCYDRRALASLAQAAQDRGHPEWGYTGPHDAGTYTSNPEETGFFRSWGGSWDTPYGQFFLAWYSGALIAHGERLIKSAAAIFNTLRPQRCTLSNHMNSSQSIIHAGPLYASPGSAQAPSSPAELSTPMLSTDSVPGSERLLRDSAFSAGDLHPNSVGRTISTLSAMSEDSAAESSGSEPDPALGDAGQGRQQEQRNPQSMPVSAPSLQQRSGAMGESTQRPELYRRPDSSASLSDGGGAQMSAGAENGDHRHSRIPADMPAGGRVEVTLKVAGIHWWYRTRSHAAELTAGYYNTAGRDGYNALIEICAKHGTGLTLTCVEMCDGQHPPEALCGPEGLLRQVREAASAAGVLMAGENALPCFSPGHVDTVALERIVYNTQAWAPPLQEESMKEAIYRGPSANSLANSASSTDTLLAATNNPASASAPDLPSKAQSLGSAHSRPATGNSLPQSELPMMRAFTFLRLTQEMLQPSYQATWLRFMHRMRHNSVRGATPQSGASRTSTGLRPLTPLNQRPAGSPQQPSGQAPLQRKGSLFVANEKGEMVPADNYLEELARQNPKWRQ